MMLTGNPHVSPFKTAKQRKSQTESTETEKELDNFGRKQEENGRREIEEEFIE